MRVERIELDVDGDRTDVAELKGRRRPDLVLLNDDDLAYAKIRLDERSLATAIAHPRAFTSSLPRALVLGAAWDMTRDAQMPAGDFVRMALATLPGEDDSTLLRTLLGQMSTAALTYSAPAKREKLVARHLRDLCLAAAPGVSSAAAALAELDVHAAAAALAAEGGWCRPEIDCVHPLDDGSAGVLYRSVDRTSAGLGAAGAAWRRLFAGPVGGYHELAEDIMRPLVGIPRHPLRLARFGVPTLLPATALARVLPDRRARALFDLCAGFVYSQVLAACVRLRVFDLLRDGPMCSDLATEG